MYDIKGEGERMSQPKIKLVENNKKKGKTYRNLIAKYNDAMTSGFYGEAELIVYAFMEDRLRSFLYYFGALKSNNRRYINEDMVELYGKSVKVDKISTKIDIIESLFKACNDKSINNDFTCDARKIIKYAINPGEVKRTLRQIKKWCEYRNEVVHGLFNKDLNDLRMGFEEHVNEGYLLARQVDRYVEMIKKV